MEMEERRSLWTTYPNVMKWFDGSKACLIHYGYAEDKRQRVVDIFAGRPMPMPIDGDYYALCYFLLDPVAHTVPVV